MPRRIRQKVTEREAVAATELITARRRAVDDPDLALLSDHPLSLIEYVLTRQRVPAAVVAADVLNALLILEYARAHVPATPGRLDAAEAGLIDAGRAAGLTLMQLAVPLGLRGRSGVENRRLRLASAARGAPRREPLERAARRSRQAQAEWLARRGDELLDAVAALLAADEMLIAAGYGEDAINISETAARVPRGRAAEHVMTMAALTGHLLIFLEDLDDASSLGVAGAVAALKELTVEHRALFLSA